MNASTIRRCVDILASTAALVVLSPLLMTIAIACRLQDGGPAFYRATRLGRQGKPFHLLKFRSMCVDADRRGPAITTLGDSRVTPLGKFLRRTKLDELPQLINVLRGEMSLVGPRPEDPRYVAMYSEEQRRLLDHPPGLTGVASLAFSDEESQLQGEDWEQQYCDRILPAKLQLDLDYLERRTLRSDALVIARTAARVVAPRRAA
ncbi:sugar transferase [Candidatus Laterigemmans baculatus]|uniref:sugar transferase n=1 Tax=Candidatus Laterigemmans baculatus TaxID=2770505 RepID=UPI0013DAA260|nr:sugar transferase [Candidatus Laterigemmans baculatus]